jgi:hypothetical protein
MNELNTDSEPSQATIGGTTFEAFPPQGFAQVVPDAPSDLSALEGADVVAHAGPVDGVKLVIFDEAAPLPEGAFADLIKYGHGVTSVQSNGTVTHIPLEQVRTDLLPHEQALQSTPTITGVEHLTGEDLTEYNRLVMRLNAQPTSEQAKQELNSFKQLHALP